jgi:hypothetical protein
MGPPPRSLAAEANDCFMVRSQCGGNRIQGRGASFRAHGGLPSVRSLSSPSGQPANRSLAKRAPITRSNSQLHELDRRRQSGFSRQKIALTKEAPYKDDPCYLRQIGYRVVTGQDVFDHELIAVLDKPDISEKAPHRHARRGENGQAHRCGYLPRRRPCGVGTGVRWPPVPVAVREPPGRRQPQSSAC